MSDKKSFLDIGLAATTPYPLDIKVKSADGVWINCQSGEKLFDAISGVGVSSFGHGNKFVLKALHAQIDLNLHTMVYGEFRHDSTEKAASLLTSFLPKNLDSVYFVNSGAEAVEGALKLSKRITGRTRMMGCHGGYHGNTHGALSLSSNAERQTPFLPLLPEVTFIDFNCHESLTLIDSTVACIIVETIQGDAGVVIATKEWLYALREKCSSVGTMLILDEIQCGIGRCGSPFAFSEYNITPDILCVGKALGGGMPIGAFISSKEKMSLLSHSPALGHITTFGGHPVACAGAVAALTLLKEIDFESIEKRGRKWESRLIAHPRVKCVRRKGYFFAVEMESEELVTKAILKGVEIGVLMFWFLSVPKAFRLQPPLTMTDKESELGISKILEALDL
tara:strand:- start:7345 stop:8526 length:1182 start_codon:yes stop_codon:yes gene_type:complete